MKITFFQSSTVMVETEDVKILNDPWLIDGELYGSWSHYPPIKLDLECLSDIDYIYLSHIHQDHFSQKTLSKLNKKIPILIHNFESKVLKNNIEKMGFSVIELDHNQRTALKNGVHINILAADNCDPAVCYKYFGCAPLEATFGSTSIDTMCIIDNGNEVLVNTNDCPYDLSYQAASIIKQKYSRIDMLLVGYTSASAYPQCFVLSDSEKLREKERLQQDFLKKAENYVNLFEPKYFMPFAGRYTLTGKLTKLNNFRGVTELDDAFEYFINSEQINSTKSKCIILNPNASFNTLIGESSEPYVKINNAEKEKYIKDILFKRKLDYEYENQPKTDEIKSFIEKSYQRFERKRVGLRFSSDTTILIKLSDTEYIAISCNGSGWKIINENQLKDYLKFVKLSLDVKLLKWILMGPKFGHWNVAGMVLIYYLNENQMCMKEVYTIAYHFFMLDLIN